MLLAVVSVALAAAAAAALWHLARQSNAPVLQEHIDPADRQRLEDILKERSGTAK